MKVMKMNEKKERKNKEKKGKLKEEKERTNFWVPDGSPYFIK